MNFNTFKGITDRDDRLYFCGWVLPLIGSGTGRQVFLLSEDLVLKVAMNEAGRRQNEVEFGIRDNDLCANIHQHHDKFEWSIMDRLHMFEPNKFDDITGTTVHDRILWWDYKSVEKGYYDEETKGRVIKRFEEKVNNYTEWEMQMLDNAHSIETLNIIFNCNLEAGDLSRYDSWGYKKDNPNKPILFDYGLNNDVWVNCYKRHMVTAMLDGEEITIHRVCIKEDIDNTFVKVNVYGVDRYLEINY